MDQFIKSKKYVLDGLNLCIDDIKNIATASLGEVFIEISPVALKKMQQSREVVEQIVKKGDAVYGINTGFGALASKKIPTEDLTQLQYNLIRSHCTGVGTPFSIEITRAIMLLRLNCLLQGFSGVSLAPVQLLVDFLNFHITPIVPQKGSVGASGDLAPLSHIALSLIGEGEVYYQGKTLASHFAIDQIGKNPCELGPKDGLALINGTAVMLAMGCLAIFEAKRIFKLADIISCLTLDAVRGTASAFHPNISKLKPHPGQLSVTENLNKILSDSEILNSHPDDGKVQDPYSLRCIPQVHGACRQTLLHAESVMLTEIMSVTDNPLVFAETNEVISGGNFHGEALALVMDYLSMGLSEICSIAERRVEKMMNPHFSDLPAFLIKDSGLNSGLMIAHVTMAALASENKYLCHPASVDSIPTSTDKEDHVSMGVTSGRKLMEIIENTYHCLSIELLCNTQGLEFLRPLKTSPSLEKVISLVRKHVSPITEDRVFYKDISNILQLLKNGEVLDAVENEIGEIN